MSALDTAQIGTTPATPRPSATEVTGWLLEGRWFTIDPQGLISAWSPAAAERFGWQRNEMVGKSFVDELLAPDARGPGAAAVASVIDRASGEAGFTGDVEALDARGVALPAVFALVPIQLSVGYEFNDLLQEIANRSGSAGSIAELKKRHESIITLIESALDGSAADAAQTEDGGRLAGALVVFGVAGSEQPGKQAGAPPSNVVSIADADARAQLDRARAELEEAGRHLQRARNEADVARQEAADAHDALAVVQREVEAGKRQVEEIRRAADEARATAEDMRIRSDEAQREADRLRVELRDARTAMRSSVEEFDDELVEARRELDWARSEAAEHKAESGRHAAEVEQLREHLQETQRELGVLRGELEATRAEHAQGAAVSDRRGSEAERLRAELEAARSEIERLTAVPVQDAETTEFAAVEAEQAAAERDGLTGDAIRRAIEDDLFQLHGQPLLDLHTDEIGQYELLIRMVGEDGKLVLPQAFLGAASRAGLAHAIDRWVVRQAIALLARVPEAVSLEVNLSPEAVHDSELPILLDEELACTTLDPGRLVLEVTGQTAADDIEATSVLAKRVRALGCRFALDDFRSTFGSFRLLKDLPLDYLKLDGELVGSLTESRTSQLIVKALVEVAEGTGAKTVAVFVSDDATLELLRQQGVDYAQGYKVGRPRPIAEIWPEDPEAPRLPLPSA